jgi:hypothetical protein
MTQYLVTWQIDEEADSPYDAAQQAFNRLRRTIPNDPGNCAVYDVRTAERPGFVRVDLGAGTIEKEPETQAAQIVRGMVAALMLTDAHALRVASAAGVTVDDVRDFMRAVLSTPREAP